VDSFLEKRHAGRNVKSNPKTCPFKLEMTLQPLKGDLVYLASTSPTISCGAASGLDSLKCDTLGCKGVGWHTP